MLRQEQALLLETQLSSEDVGAEADCCGYGGEDGGGGGDGDGGGGGRDGGGRKEGIVTAIS